jgi:antitoxin component of MazEF toxin-antitoxin module
MPLKRKLIDVGNSRAVVIPAEWLKEKEDRTGRQIEYILLEVNGVTITVEEPENKQP